MVTTIDGAGRLVVPKSLREQFNLTPGCELVIEAAANGITLRRADGEPALIRKQGILVHHGTARVPVDIGEFVRAERRARSTRIARGVG
ncbi:MAG: AbrB/MazE/SpoVT family DNA-binding domain-containing protein [Pseudomonadales bacterium]|nr:AbrB/MazE/SpoVT family DNA-binding domain-containing protein [Pseudomonadales bacterium]